MNEFFAIAGGFLPLVLACTIGIDKATDVSHTAGSQTAVPLTTD